MRTSAFPLIFAGRALTTASTAAFALSAVSIPVIGAPEP